MGAGATARQSTKAMVGERRRMRITTYIADRQYKRLRAYADLQDLSVYTLVKRLILSYIRDNDYLWDEAQEKSIDAEYWRNKMEI